MSLGRFLRSFIGLGLLALASPSPASASPVCEGSKIRAGGAALAAALQCHVRAVRRGEAVDADCLDRAVTRLSRAFVRAEARGDCDFLGDADTVASLVLLAAEDLAAALDVDPSRRRCTGAKLRGSRRTAAATLACHRRAARAGAEVDLACTSRASDRLATLFARYEGNLLCATAGDHGAIATTLVDLAEIVASVIRSGASPGDGAPSGLMAAVSGDDVELTWLAPEPASGHTHVRVLRRLGSAPTGPEDAVATVVYFGAAELASDPISGLLPSTSLTSRTYHYAAYGCTGAGVCESTGTSTTFALALVDALRAGGYTIHWRHASANVCADRTDLGTAATTSVPDWWKSCDASCPPAGMATARQLNAAGVTESISLGERFDELGIVIGRVISSEFCRNFTTAALMDFGPTVELSQAITFFVYDEASRCANTNTLLAEVPAAGTNTALIGHAGFSCGVLGSLAWSEAAVFRPDGMGGAELMERVLWDAW